MSIAVNGWRHFGAREAVNCGELPSEGRGHLALDGAPQMLHMCSMEPLCSSGSGRYQARRASSTVLPRPRETCLSRAAAQPTLCCLAKSTLLCLRLVLSGVLKQAHSPRRGRSLAARQHGRAAWPIIT